MYFLCYMRTLGDSYFWWQTCKYHVCTALNWEQIDPRYILLEHTVNIT